MSLYSLSATFQTVGSGFHCLNDTSGLRPMNLRNSLSWRDREGEMSTRRAQHNHRCHELCMYPTLALARC
jgi:hypothetical protein